MFFVIINVYGSHPLSKERQARICSSHSSGWIVKGLKSLNRMDCQRITVIGMEPVNVFLSSMYTDSIHRQRNVKHAFVQVTHPDGVSHAPTTYLPKGKDRPQPNHPDPQREKEKPLPNHLYRNEKKRDMETEAETTAQQPRERETQKRDGNK